MNIYLIKEGNCKGEDRRTVCGNGSIPLSHSGNVVTRIGTHTHNCKGINI